MRAMILAAGRGQRLQSVLNAQPKPLIEVGGKTLLEHQLSRLVAIGVNDVVINVAHKAKQIIETVGDGQRYGISIHYSFEGEAPIGVAQGVRQALPLLGKEPFLLVSSDVISDYPLQQLTLAKGDLAKIVLVDADKADEVGQFAIVDGYVQQAENNPLVYGGGGLFQAAFFTAEVSGSNHFYQLLQLAIKQRTLAGEYHAGEWHNVNSLQDLVRLRQLNL